MDEAVIEKRLKEYKSDKYNVGKLYALSGWINAKNKPFRLNDALICIYNYANGKFSVMNDIIDHLTYKKKINGRANLASDSTPSNAMDIINDNGTLKLVGYEYAPELNLKGQKGHDNSNFYKSNGEINKNTAKRSENFVNVGAEVRKIWPNESKTFIALAIVAILKYSSAKKINKNKVIEGLKNGSLKLDDENFKIYSTKNEQKIVIISDKMAKLIMEDIQMSEYKFTNCIKSFLHDLLVDPVNAIPPYELRMYGYNRSKLLRYLINYGIVDKKEKIVDGDKEKGIDKSYMKVSFKVPKAHFDRKLKRLYIRLFEKNVLEKINEDGEVADGATNASSSGQYSQPLFGVQRRNIYGQMKECDGSQFGDYQYDVPFPGDKETLSRKNGVGGSVSVNINK